MSATDANRFVLRFVRHLTGRPRIAVMDWCYHGTVDEAFATLDGDRVVPRPGLLGAPVDVAETTAVIPFNDPDALDRRLAHGDVACLLMEPALTNIGIVLPEPGYLEGVRELTRRHGTYLINDETHTFSAGPGGATAAWSLDPDVVTIGKAIGGGIPIGAYGLSADLAAALTGRTDLDLVDMGGVGGTLAGNPVSLVATRATLEEVLTDAAFAQMIAVATAFEDGIRKIIERHGLPWSVSRLGARVEYRFATPAPRTGTASAASADPGLEDFLHLYLANRGILLTPFHNMALMCPQTSTDDVARHHEIFEAALGEL
jgi:glutamate-1-semialdehyde 2,1-aminomutase